MAYPANKCYHVILCNHEAAATVRDLRTILEAELTTLLGSTFTFDSPLAVFVGIQNKAAANSIYIQSSDQLTANLNVELAAGTFRQVPSAGAFRIPLNEVRVRVAADNDPFVVEILFE